MWRLNVWKLFLLSGQRLSFWITKIQLLVHSLYVSLSTSKLERYPKSIPVCASYSGYSHSTLYKAISCNVPEVEALIGFHFRFREKLPSDRLALFTPPRQLSSYYDGAVNYYLGQTVMCHLNTGNYVGVIKYIGNPESKGIRFGILFSQYTKSQFSGSINVTPYSLFYL